MLRLVFGFFGPERRRFGCGGDAGSGGSGGRRRGGPGVISSSRDRPASRSAPRPLGVRVSTRGFEDVDEKRASKVASRTWRSREPSQKRAGTPWRRCSMRGRARLQGRLRLGSTRNPSMPIRACPRVETVGACLHRRIRKGHPRCGRPFRVSAIRLSTSIRRRTEAPSKCRRPGCNCCRSGSRYMRARWYRRRKRGAERRATGDGVAGASHAVIAEPRRGGLRGRGLRAVRHAVRSRLDRSGGQLGKQPRTSPLGRHSRRVEALRRPAYGTKTDNHCRSPMTRRHPCRSTPAQSMYTRSSYTAMFSSVVHAVATGDAAGAAPPPVRGGTGVTFVIGRSTVTGRCRASQCENPNKIG